MASLQQGEKQLFEKFWKGTFKAVATPRPESIIVASITARRTVNKLETSLCLAPKDKESKLETEDTVANNPTNRKGHVKERRRKRHGRHRSRSTCLNADHSPRPASKGKKKKKKSDRKRRRERSPTCSPSPLRKKKKKKKNSKKRKRRRSASKKRRHSASCSRRKRKDDRKDDRKHKKRSRHRSRRRQRYRRSEVEVSVWRSSSTESRNHLSRSEEHSGHPARLGEDVHLSVNQRGFEWGSDVPKLANKIPPNCSANPPRNSIGPSQPGHGILSKQTAVLANQNKGQPDYDSGNDTSSPPSSKTDGSRLNVNGDNKSTSLEKLRFMDGDSTSDSGNSVTSYVSLSKPETSESDLSASIFRKNSDRTPVRGATVVGNSRLGVTATDRSLSPPPYSRHRRRSSSSRCRSFSSRSSRSSYHHSRSSSFSSGKRSYSRSLSYSPDSRRGSVCSTNSFRSPRYCRYTPDRARERKRGSSSGMKGSKRSRKQSRRRPYSPIRKRRRDSPSHLEARRITSARKRPIPYYRPSPSSSSRSSSLSSWYSLFSRSRSRSRSRSCSRSRCRSYSSYRTYSRSSSWNSIFGSHSQSRSRSRSRSYDSLTSYSRGRR